METKLQKAFKEGLNLHNPIDFENLMFAKSKGWDSIAHMKLIAAIEEEFKINLEVDDVLSLSSYPTAKKIVEKYAK